MDFNLNISTKLSKRPSEKTSLNSFLSNSVDFENIISSLDLDKDNTSNDNSMDIMSLLQNLISNMKLFKEIGSTDNDIKKEIDFIINKLNNQNLQLGLSDINEDKLSYKDIKSEVNLLKETSNVLKPNHEINIKQMSKKTGEKTTNPIELDNLSTLNMIEKLDDEIKNLKSYEELNVSTNTNKSNVIAMKPKKDDKDLNILENILDKNVSVFSTVSNKAFIQDSVANKNLPVVTIRANNMADDFIKMVKYLKNNNIEEIKVNIKPKELGDMTIKLMKDSEATKVFINVSKEDTFKMLNKNISDINKHLFDLGIKAKDVVVTMKSNSENFFSDNLSQQFGKREEPRKQKRNNHKQVSSIEDIEEVANSQENFNILA
ncbi:flagellar hook-length control protein FliK [Paeniclostridium hominis]|uniref:flagellar hook-length control protein FliK n=1 Tax=Paeniclostridium hominis TaxID=2764329 RepID=UPI0022E5E62A|nr:flagellar hook-length control protein FliK [Paeniclostridium hominis]